jgi:hypothetical protein
MSHLAGVVQAALRILAELQLKQVALHNLVCSCCLDSHRLGWLGWLGATRQLPRSLQKAACKRIQPVATGHGGGGESEC